MQTKNNNSREMEWSEFLLAEQLVLGLFGKILFDYPEKEWYDTLVREGIFDEIPFGENQKDVQDGMQILSAWSNEQNANLSEETFEEICADYTRLLIGPAKVLAPPWESMYFSKERTIFQEQTLEVREWYRRFGLESVKLYNEPDDHIGLELAFVSQLAGMAYTALDAHETDQFDKLIEAQKSFLENHTLKWAAGWATLVLENAHTEFFKGVALVIRGILLEVQTLLVEE